MRYHQTHKPHCIIITDGHLKLMSRLVRIDSWVAGVQISKCRSKHAVWRQHDVYFRFIHTRTSMGRCLQRGTQHQGRTREKTVYKNETTCQALRGRRRESVARRVRLRNNRLQCAAPLHHRKAATSQPCLAALLAGLVKRTNVLRPVYWPASGSRSNR
jgi:hypothetical protein